MTPRGVQVWFQNRRAKTKQQAKKAEAAATANGGKPPADSSSTATSPYDPLAIAPCPDADEDDETKDEDALSPALPPSPLPPQSSEDTSPEETAIPLPSAASHSNANVDQLPNSTPDSRRGSIAHPVPLATWASSSPSTSSAPPTAPPPPSAAATSSTLGSPDLSGHVNAHVRLSTHPPSANSHTHLTVPDSAFLRRGSLPASALSSTLGHGRMAPTLQKRGFDPSARRRSTDMGGHRMMAHPYAHVAASANSQGMNAHATLNEGDELLHAQQPIRRPQLAPRLSAPFPHQGNNAMSGHPHSMPIVPSQRQQLPNQRHYDVSPIHVVSPHSPVYHQNAPGQGYDMFAPRHSIDGSALSLMQAQAHMNMGMHGQMNTGLDNGDAFGMSMSAHDGRYAISQRPIAPPVPGPLPSPNFSFGNPFVPGSSSNSSSNSASGTPPNGSSPSLLSLPRRASEGGVSDADTEESSAGPLSRFGSVASLGGSEVSWTSAYTSEGAPGEGEEANICGSRRESCASTGHFLEMFNELDVGSNGGTPAPPGMHEQHQLHHVPSTAHLSPNGYAHHVQPHSPDGLAGQQQSAEDGGYPSPSSASTISAGSTHSPHTHDTTAQHTNISSGSGRTQGHVRTNTSSELAYALSGDDSYAQASASKDNVAQLQYPVYSTEQGEAGTSDYHYAQEQVHQSHQDYSKGQQMAAHFPTLYEGYVYPPDGQVPGEGTGGMNEAYAAGAIELSHMCVPASQFMGGYMQYS
ncbi:hypothetical protein L227DRAFT_543015 [Lentinus tigrinus ALCF2SS1-6]|uniref:Homeobox domain-containing protein n=1 Tax=Lentinus tigrinus ALCF2SS1-6 TaxID=1328759 RepID=A0A5C2SJH3_9APHY|nr:hypothetical protein L227DRAFT_543015 [Lentinus tigrinus ALCF2SS1-6]